MNKLGIRGIEITFSGTQEINGIKEVGLPYSILPGKGIEFIIELQRLLFNAFE